MESALVRADLEHPGALSPLEVRRLRYVLSVARLTSFQPGATERARRTDRPEVSLGGEIDGFRTRVVDDLSGPLRAEKDALERLRGARAALERLSGPLESARRTLVERHADDFSASELDAEVGRKVLVNVAGGGGGAGFVYIGAYERLERAGIVPAYVIGSSIGALLGLFRARAARGAWDAYTTLAKQLDRQTLFSPIGVRRRYGLPGLLSLDLASSIGATFARGDGDPLRIGDLEVPYEAVVAGVRRRSFERLPRRLRQSPAPSARRASAPAERRSRLALAPAIARRMWQVALFFDPRVVKAIALGADELTTGFNAVDAAGFSAAIPGVIHYDVDEGDERMDRLLAQLFEREDVAALVDGGVASNVPAELAWRRVQAGKLGTRNAFYLAFDCFHPQWDPRHLWLQPITQAVALQMTRNAPFADWLLRFEPTLSPIDLVPEPERLDQAIEWGRQSVEEVLPMIERFLEPVSW